MEKVLWFVTKLLPKNKIGAWILGVISAALALALGVSSVDLKDSFCRAEAVKLPVEAAPAQPAEPAK